MKSKDQVKLVKSKFEISNHTFVNQLSTGLQNKILNDVPNIKLSTSKNEDSNYITISIVGSMNVKNDEEKKDVENDVRRIIDSLKNQSTLLSMLE